MINFIDEAIKDFLLTEASLSDTDVSFVIPSKEWSSSVDKTTVNLYLIDGRENTELRRNEWEADRKSDGSITEKKPPVRIDLFYMTTAYSTKNGNAGILEEHYLLGAILAAVYSHAFIPEDPYLTDNLPPGMPVPKIPIESVHPKFLDEQGGFQVWSAVDQFLKPAVYLKVTIPIQLQQKVEKEAVLAKIMKYETPQPEIFVQMGGIVTDNASDPSVIFGAEVKLLDLDGKVVDTKRTGSDGNFLFKDVADGKYSLLVVAAGYREKSVAIDKASEVGKEELIIKLETT